MQGVENLIELVERSVDMSCVDDTVESIMGEFCKLIRSNKLEIPAAVTKPVAGHYARRLIHKDEERDFSIVAMTWGPCQGTAIHDHSGMWCVEGVWAGSINVQQYELMEHDTDSDRYRFEKRNSYEAGRGSAGCLIPPYEYHLIENPCDASPAVSLHIYGGEMRSCCVFENDDDGWCRKVEKPLGYDN